MKKKEFAKGFAEKHEITQDEARNICYAVFEYLGEMLDRGEDVYIHRLGTFKHEVRKAKNVRHPKTGEMTMIPERTVITFKRTVSKFDEEE